MSLSNLPPGCTNADIERAFGEQVSSAQSDEIAARIDPIIDEMSSLRFRRVRALAAELQKALDFSCDLTDSLVDDRGQALGLLAAALRFVPADPVCNCKPIYGTHADTCPVAGTPIEYGEPTLRAEIEALLGQFK